MFTDKLTPTQLKLWRELRKLGPHTVPELFTLLPIAGHDEPDRDIAEMVPAVKQHIVSLRKLLRPSGYDIVCREDNVIGIYYSLVQDVSWTRDDD